MCGDGFPSPVEPLRANRWILQLGKIPPYLLRNVTLETVTEKIGRKSEVYTKLIQWAEFFAIYDNQLRFGSIS